MSQLETITTEQLYEKGYNLRQAAREISKSVEHVRLVLLGQRHSRVIIEALIALPNREYKARRPIKTNLRQAIKS